ncbi:MAG: C10 family peptidase, partial [Planctomycetota bacterium]|nr:C10 family peptidase [Planctomycetota bacterium]
MFTLISRASFEPRRLVFPAALLLFIALLQAQFFPSPAAGAEVTRAQARAAAEGFIVSRANGARGELSVERIREIESAGGVFAFIADLAPAGFVIVSADTRLEPILGYNFSGTLPFRDLGYSPLLHLVLADVSARLRRADKRPEESRARVQGNERRWRRVFTPPDGSGAGEAETWGPLLQREPNPNNRHLWGQVHSGEDENYNGSCPLVGNGLETGTDPGEELALVRPPVGCAAISICQIMEYWQHPQRMELLYEDEKGNGEPPPGGPPGPGGQVGVNDITAPDNYEFLRCMLAAGDECRLDETIRIPEDAVRRNFATFEDLSGEVTYNEDFGSLTDGFFRIGIKIQARYGSRGSAVEATAENYLEDFFFGSARQVVDPAGVWNPVTAGIATSNIRLGRPCHLSIMGLRPGDERPVFHSVVLDGYRSTGEFHLTFGWDGTGNAWYSLPDIPVDLDGEDGVDFEFDVIRKIIYDISPEKAWSQFGANARSSFQSPYAAPVQDPPMSKWRLNTNGVGEFKELIVGQGNIIFATVSGTPEAPPALWKISQFGEVRTRLVFEGETGITGPVQNSWGELFVGFASGSIYKIDPALRSSRLIFPPPEAPPEFRERFNSGRISPASLALDAVVPGSPPHVEEGLYYRTEGRDGGDGRDGMVYKIDRMGLPVWEYRARMSNSDSLAINSARNRVYFSYFDKGSGYLVALDSETGGELETGPFTITALGPVEMAISAPSIDEEGNVYVGVEGGIAKLDWDLRLLRIRQDLSPPSPRPGIAIVPVIGNRGNVILSHRMNDDQGRPLLAVSSLDRDTLETRWVWSRAADSMEDMPGQAYIALNDVVVTTFSRSPAEPAR